MGPGGAHGDAGQLLSRCEKRESVSVSIKKRKRRRPLSGEMIRASGVGGVGVTFSYPPHGDARRHNEETTKRDYFQRDVSRGAVE